MRTKIFPASVLAAAVLLVSMVSFAQTGLKWKGSGGWGPGSDYTKLYDPKTVETVKGTVVSLDNIVPFPGMFQGLTLILQTKDAKVPVHLGPVWWLENQDIKIEPGDKLEVRGSRVNFEDEPTIIAATVIKEGLITLRLRDEKTGYPAWSGILP